MCCPAGGPLAPSSADRTYRIAVAFGTSSVNSDTPGSHLLPYDVTKAGIANFMAALAEVEDGRQVQGQGVAPSCWLISVMWSWVIGNAALLTSTSRFPIESTAVEITEPQ